MLFFLKEGIRTFIRVPFADSSVSAGGSTLEEAFEGAALAMYNYMSPIAGIRPDPALARYGISCNVDISTDSTVCNRLLLAT